MEKLIFENTNWKKTLLGTNIEIFASKKLDALKRPLLIVGGVHGDEPEGVYLCQKLLAELKSLSQKCNREWILIPCLNPDGLLKNQRVNSNGVDLNRNFPSPDWSAEFKQDRYFPGSSPCSEIETQALVDLIQSCMPDTIIHCHSWKPSIVYTWPTPPNEAILLSQVSNYDLQPDIGYPTPGSLGQFGLSLNIPVVCIEERETASAQETWIRFHKAFRKILGMP